MRSVGPIVFAALLCSAIGCSDPYSRVVPADPSTWTNDADFVEAVKKLPDDEKKALLAYAMRSAMGKAFNGGATVPVGLTVKEVIAEQKAWQQERANEEAAQAELKAKVEAAAQALRAQMNAVATVAVTSLQYQKIRYQDFIAIEIAFENKTDRPIAGIKGTMIINDMFGDHIKDVNFSYDDGLGAKAVKTWTGQLDYNQFISEDKKLANTSLDKMKIEWRPSVYLFADGSKLEVPAAP